jgi:hypothetical protein
VIKAPIEKFLKFKDLKMDVVVVGRFGLPDAGVTVPGYSNQGTFLVHGLYNRDLSEFIAE